MIRVGIEGAAFFSTHHASAGEALAGRSRPPAVPGYALLVGRARRFTSLVTQLHVEVCGALPRDTEDPPLAVFATRHGEIQTAEKLIADFHASRMVSSARFALSVHNTASGVYAVAVGSAAASTTVTGDNAIAAGWLEAALTAIDSGRRVLLSIADEAVPAVFAGPDEPVGVAAAFLLGPAGRRAELAIVPSAALADDAVRMLAGATDAATGDAARTIALGAIQPGHALELHFPAQEARA